MLAHAICALRNKWRFALCDTSKLCCIAIVIQGSCNVILCVAGRQRYRRADVRRRTVWQRSRWRRVTKRGGGGGRSSRGARPAPPDVQHGGCQTARPRTALVAAAATIADDGWTRVTALLSTTARARARAAQAYGPLSPLRLAAPRQPILWPWPDGASRDGPP